MKKPIWEYNNTFYLKINAVKVMLICYGKMRCRLKLASKKDIPYIMDLSFTKYDFQKNGEQITGHSILKLLKVFQIYIYIYIYRMRLSESSFNTITKPFSFF